MTFTRWTRPGRWMQGAAGIILISALAGCDRDEPKVYHIPKDDSQPAQTTPAPDATQDSSPTPAQQDAAQPDNAQPMLQQLPAAGTPSPDASGAMTPAAMSLPRLGYKLPAGWQEKPPSEMRVASFTALGPSGQSADISVIPLPIMGRDMELVNMWRSQVQLPPTTDPDAVKQAETIPIGDGQGRLFTFVSEQPMIGKSRQRMYIAWLTRGTMSWFFKIAGEDAFVASQKDNFLHFLKSVTFADDGGDQMVSTPVPMSAPSTADADSNSNAGGSIWTPPPGWESKPPSQFLLAEYSVAGVNGAKAEVNVAEMGGGGGGLLPNVNRWRGQLGLGALGENDLAQVAQALDVPDGKATLVDFTGVDAKSGAPSRLVGVIVALNDETWFYKMMGDQQTVAQQKDAFTKFIQSANYANAR